MNKFLQDNDGHNSSKRLITLLSILLISTGFLANLFGGYQIEEFIFNGVMYIAIAGLGITGAEKFASAISK